MSKFSAIKDLVL